MEDEGDEAVDLKIEGKRALVLGGNRGMGLAIARALAAEGAAGQRQAPVGRRHGHRAPAGAPGNPHPPHSTHTCSCAVYSFSMRSIKCSIHSSPSVRFALRLLARRACGSSDGERQQERERR